jgi:hypothetical protein
MSNGLTSGPVSSPGRASSPSRSRPMDEGAEAIAQVVRKKPSSLAPWASLWSSEAPMDSR